MRCDAVGTGGSYRRTEERLHCNEGVDSTETSLSVLAVFSKVFRGILEGSRKTSAPFVT